MVNQICTLSQPTSLFIGNKRALLPVYKSTKKSQTEKIQVRPGSLSHEHVLKRKTHREARGSPAGKQVGVIATIPIFTANINFYFNQIQSGVRNPSRACTTPLV